MARFFLTVGEVVSLIGCFAALANLLVCFAVGGPYVLLRVLGSAVAFCYSVAMLIVFGRVKLMETFHPDHFPQSADSRPDADTGDVELETPDDSSPMVDDTSTPTTCLSCGTQIPAGSNRCPQCGWSYVPDS